MTKKAKLKPCPFCGGDVEIYQPNNDACRKWNYFYLRHIQMDGKKICWLSLIQREINFTGQERAITAWNKRDGKEA